MKHQFNLYLEWGLAPCFLTDLMLPKGSVTFRQETLIKLSATDNPSD